MVLLLCIRQRLFLWYFTEFKVPSTIRNTVNLCTIKKEDGTSLVVQWLRICLPMQGTWVRSLPGRSHMLRSN